MVPSSRRCPGTGAYSGGADIAYGAYGSDYAYAADGADGSRRRRWGRWWFGAAAGGGGNRFQAGGAVE